MLATHLLKLHIQLSQPLKVFSLRTQPSFLSLLKVLRLVALFSLQFLLFLILLRLIVFLQR